MIEVEIANLIDLTNLLVGYISANILDEDIIEKIKSSQFDLEEPMIFFQGDIYMRISFRIINQEVYYFVTMMNVVEKVAILNLHESLNFKNKLIHSLSHEIRTPINYIIEANERIKYQIVQYLDPVK
jgi:signal transduction histidine kinase/CheY-like chemotaxis protein